MKRSLILLCAACGKSPDAIALPTAYSSSPAVLPSRAISSSTEAPSGPAECHPVLSGCGCAYGCVHGVRMTAKGRGMARWQIPDQTTEATLERWCFDAMGHAQTGTKPGFTRCLDVFNDRTSCGGECLPTTEFLSCHAVDDRCQK